METRFSPLSRTRPRTLFSSRSGCFEFFGLKDRDRLIAQHASVLTKNMVSLN